MVCNHEIEIPVQYVSRMFQVSSTHISFIDFSKCERPTVSGKITDVGDVEEDKSKKVHNEGYEVPHTSGPCRFCQHNKGA